MTPEQAKRSEDRQAHDHPRRRPRDFVEVDILAVPVQHRRPPAALLRRPARATSTTADSLMTDLFQTQDIREAAPAAIRHANACGGEDNITALFVEFLATP
jgi:hypothetical protein